MFIKMIKVLFVGSLLTSATCFAQDKAELGQALSAFSFELGTPDAICRPPALSYDNCYQQGKIAVRVQNGRVADITQDWSTDRPKSLAEAKRRMKRFLPSDAKFVKSIVNSSGSAADIYVSATLGKEFSADIPLHHKDGRVVGRLNTWGGSKPGTFVVVYAPHAGLIGLGDNP